MPAIRPVAIDSTYPSTPQIWPAKNTRGCCFICSVSLNSVGRVDVGVAVDLPVAQEPRVLQAGNQAQHAGLIAELQVILKADQVVGIGAQIFLPQLHHSVGNAARCADLSTPPASWGRSAACRGRGGRFLRWAGSLRNNSASPSRAASTDCPATNASQKRSYSSFDMGQLM